MRSTANISTENDSPGSKRPRPQDSIQSQNIFNSEASKRLCLDDLSQTSEQIDDSFIWG